MHKNAVMKIANDDDLSTSLYCNERKKKKKGNWHQSYSGW